MRWIDEVVSDPRKAGRLREAWSEAARRAALEARRAKSGGGLHTISSFNEEFPVAHPILVDGVHEGHVRAPAQENWLRGERPTVAVRHRNERGHIVDAHVSIDRVSHRK